MVLSVGIALLILTANSMWLAKTQYELTHVFAWVQMLGISLPMTFILTLVYGLEVKLEKALRTKT